MQRSWARILLGMFGEVQVSGTDRAEGELGGQFMKDAGAGGGGRSRQEV